MSIPVLYSLKTIEQQYRTGEEPVLVLCSDMNAYVCKYMRSFAAAYKLACELIGSCMAMAWQMITPEVDVTPSTNGDVESSIEILRQLMKIALFDFWIANEDRNANNANLLYDVGVGELISIDYGCILNTATFNYSMSQLTSTDTILWSDLFQHLVKGKDKAAVVAIADELKTDYEECLERSEQQVDVIVKELPKEWNVNENVVKEKLQQLFDEQWTKGVWNNFVECLNDNLDNEKFEI